MPNTNVGQDLPVRLTYENRPLAGARAACLGMQHLEEMRERLPDITLVSPVDIDGAIGA